MIPNLSIRPLTCILFATFAGIAAGQTTFTASSNLNLASSSTTTTFNVSGVSAITKVTLTLGNIDFTKSDSAGNNLSNFGFVLAGPSGAKFIDLLDASNNVSGSTSITLDDSASSALPTGNPGVPIPSGTYKPGDYAGFDTYPSPIGTTTSTTSAATTGSATLSNTFNGLSGTNANGTWTLYMVVFQSAGQMTGTISSISIAITSTSAPSTTTVLSSSQNPSFTSSPNNSVTLTATVSSTSTVNAGTVAFSDGGTQIAGCGSQPVSSGTATCVTTFSTQGLHSLAANYTDVSNAFGPSVGALSQTVDGHTTLSGTSLCNNGGITIPSGGPSGVGASAYPWNLLIGQTINGHTEPTLSGIIEKVTISLNNFTFGDPGLLGLVLVSPGGTAYEFMSNTGGGTGISGVNLTFDDAGGSTIPFNGPISSGTYKPTSDVDMTTNSDAYPLPAPQTFAKAEPTGTATLLGEFGGQGLNGTWQLYLSDRASGDTGSIGGFCLNLTMQANADGTSTSVTTSPNPATTGTTVTLTATVSDTTNSSTVVSAGTVTFTDGANTVGSAGVSNGTASITTNTLAEGTHHIVASFGGTSSSPVFGVSSGSVNLRVNNAITESGTYSYCNSGQIVVPGNSAATGAAGPYPSNILVSNLPGTVKSLTLSLKNVTAGELNFIDSLLVSPSGANLDFFSQTTSGGSAGAIGTPVNITFDDTAAILVPSSGIAASGSFRPTSDQPSTPNTYPQCPPNATNCASPPVGPPLASNPFTPSNFAAPRGTSILGNANAAGVFGGTSASTANGNGTWSLYMNEPPANEEANNVTVGAGWCLNFTQNAPVISIAKSHSGNFTQGQQGASFSVAVTNNGPGPTGGTLTVTDTFPTGLTPTGAGTGTDSSWSCSASGQAVTCTNSTAVSASGTYPALILASNVSPTAPGSVSNTASASGGGSTGTVTSNTDTVTINAAPVLGVSKQHTVAVVQGGIVTYAITVTNTATNSTTSGVVTVADAPPAGLTYDATHSTPNGWSCSVNAGEVTCTITQAVAGGSSYPSLTLAFDVSSTQSGVVSNTAVASGGGAASSASGTDTTSVTQTTTTIAANESVTFSSTNQNVGLLATVTTNPGVVNSGTVTFTVKNGGATVGTPVTSGTVTNGTATATYILPGGTAAGTYIIVATYNPGTGFVTSTENTATLTVNPTAPTISKAFNPTTIVSGTTSMVTLTLSNSSAVQLTGGSFNDTLANMSAAGGSVTGTCAGTVPTSLTAGATGLSFSGITIPANSSCTVVFSVTSSSPGVQPNTTSGVRTTQTPTAGTVSNTASLTVNSPQVTVTGVTSTVANGTYGVGAVIPIVIMFSNAVNVTGTPQLALNSGGAANYTSGSGTNALTFTYTVAAGQNANPLDESSTSALTLNGGTILDSSSAPANLALPAPGTTGALGVNKDIVINTAAPTVANVSSTAANGTYGSGAVIPITVTFSDPVNVTGTPQLALNSGGTAGYTSGSGTSTLTFTYTVSGGQNANPLNESSTTALSLNGGTIVDALSSTPANLTLPAPGAPGSLGTNKNIVISTTAPTVSNVSSTVTNGTYGIGAVIPITITFSDAVNVTGTPILALNSGGAASYSSGSGTSTLTFTYTVAAGQNANPLDESSTSALTLNGGTIVDSASSTPASLTLPAPGAARSLSANKNIVINTVATPTSVVSFNVLWGSESYNVIGSPRNRLPWKITAISVVFSNTITSANVNSLSGTGITTTALSGLGTNTLTWTISPIAIGSFSATLAATGPNAIIDSNSSPLGSGTPFIQNFKILEGDVNDDGVVNASDLQLVLNGTKQPYNIVLDINGDGVVNVADYAIERTLIGTSLP